MNTKFRNNYLELIETMMMDSRLDFNKHLNLYSSLYQYELINIECDNSCTDWFGDATKYNEFFFVHIIKKNNLPLIRLFVEKNNIDININNGHALRRAIYRSYTDIVEYLLSRPNIVVYNTHFTRRQYRYLETNNKLSTSIEKLFKKYNPKLFKKEKVNQQLMMACCLQNTEKIKSLLFDEGADVLSLGPVDFVFQHPLYRQNEMLLEEYAKKYFALKRITRILFGRRGIVHDIRYKLGRKRIFAEFDGLDEYIRKRM
jgi:hypothetical protein